MSTRSTILVVEDDPAIRRGLADALEFAGYAALQCGDGAAAVQLACEADPQLVLLDVMLPRRDGFSILAELRKIRPALPVIMVTARGAEGDRVRGLDDGADDYVVKPFSARELLARVEAVLRRSPERPCQVAQLRAGEMTINLERREVRLDGGAVQHLSDREAGILRHLASNPSRAVDRDELLLRVWGLNPRGLETRTVDMHVARLREKLAGLDGAPQVIRTVRGKGYMLDESVVVE